MEAPLYSRHEQLLIDLISAIPVGYVTSQQTLAGKIYGDKVPRNACSNITKSLNNLQGRATIAQHRVLKNTRANDRNGPRFQVRDPGHSALLRAEGVSVDIGGRLGTLESFWDYTPECERAYAAKVNSTEDAGADSDGPTAAVDGVEAAEKMDGDEGDLWEDGLGLEWIAQDLDAALVALADGDE